MNLQRCDKFHFDQYQFDRQRLTLSDRNGPVSLRPKTACLLALFLEQNDRVLSKACIIEQVWQRSHVQDQSLFQAISELRRVLAPLEPITTLPNQGYRWNQPVRRVGLVPRSVAIAASILATMGLAGLSSSWSAPDPSSVASEQWPPSLRAFGSGMQHLEQAQVGEAQRYFALALRENPSFEEARLMLAETLLAQGKIDEASAHASALLQSKMSEDAYTSVSAMSLMGRGKLSAGDPDRALHWALAAAQQARDEGFACAAANMEDRIAELLAQSPSAAPTASRPLVDAASDEGPLASSLMAVANGASRPDYCLQIDALPGGPGAHLESQPCLIGGRTRRQFV